MKSNNKLILCCVLAVVFALAAVFFAIWGMKQRSRAEEYFDAAGDYMSAAYSFYDRSVNELADNVSSMEVSLAKLCVAATPLQSVPALSEIASSGAAAAKGTAGSASWFKTVFPSGNA